MNLITNVKLDDMAHQADQKFLGISKRMSGLDEQFVHKMEGASLVKLIFSILGNICWIAGVIYLYFTYVRGSRVNATFSLSVFGIVILLIVMLMSNGILTYRYYKRIHVLDRNLHDLEMKVNNDRASLHAKAQAWLKYESAKWVHPIKIGQSIPGRVAEMENELGRMNRVTSGFLAKVRIALYYISCILLTVGGSWYFYGVAENIIKLFKFSLGEDLATILLRIAIAVACVGEYFVAEWVYSLMDCKVNNFALLAMAIGPLLFLALVFVGCLLVRLLAIALAIIIAIGSFIVAFTCLCGFFSGG